MDVCMAVAASLPDEAELAIEDYDSIEFFRIDDAQSAFPLANPEIKLRTISKISGNRLPDLSSPLLE